MKLVGLAGKFGWLKTSTSQTLKMAILSLKRKRQKNGKKLVTLANRHGAITTMTHSLEVNLVNSTIGMQSRTQGASRLKAGLCHQTKIGFDFTSTSPNKITTAWPYCISHSLGIIRMLMPYTFMHMAQGTEKKVLLFQIWENSPVFGVKTRLTVTAQMPYTSTTKFFPFK